MTNGILVGVRPIDGNQPARLTLQHNDQRHSLELTPGQELTISADKHTKYCTGWYEVGTHSGHVCEQGAIVDAKHEQCFVCRKKTDFNPAFYNTTEISDKQAAYNSQPHSLYIAYFGGDLAKAGISADSRGLRRLREQGAILYAIIDSFPSADIAHYHEARLIAGGLRNSVSKRQKAKVLEGVIHTSHEAAKLQKILSDLDYTDRTVMDQLDEYFYGAYPDEGIIQISDQPISGTVRGIVGRYLVLENNQRLYGTWLDSLLGYPITVEDQIISITPPKEQISLF